MADHYHEFQMLGAEVLGISTDSVYSHKIFVQTSPSAQKVQFPLLSDSTQKICQKYGALDPRGGKGTRTTIIISPEGLVKCFHKYPLPVGRNIPEIIRILHGLQFTASSGQGSPADWQPGQQGMPTDWNMVGKI